jgi:hypothetical protein
MSNKIELAKANPITHLKRAAIIAGPALVAAGAFAVGAGAQTTDPTVNWTSISDMINGAATIMPAVTNLIIAVVPAILVMAVVNFITGVFAGILYMLMSSFNRNL